MTGIRTYKLNRAVKEGEVTRYSLTVPHEMGRHVPTDLPFKPEFTDDGILFRPIEGDLEPDPVDVPTWASNRSDTPAAA